MMTTTARVNLYEDVVDAVRGVLPSPLPAIVFSGLASACVPSFSDRCQVLIEEDGLAGYRIERPTIDGVTGFWPDVQLPTRAAWSGQVVDDHTVQIGFAGSPAYGHAGYRVRVLYGWDADYTPTESDLALAQIAVDHAGAVVERERELSTAY